MVASITMLEFISDQDRVLHEIYRVLKPGGWLILGCLNANSILGERKEQDEVFKYAHFLTAENIRRKLKIIGKPELKCGVYLSAEYELLDTINNPEVVEPVFIGVVVQKIR